MADDDQQDPPPDVNTPTLTLKDGGWPLPATGDVPGGSGDPPDPNAAPPVVPAFSVTPQTLRLAQGNVLPASEAAVNGYESLKDSTNAKKNWIFQQASDGDLGQTYTWNVASQGTQVTNNQADDDLVKETPKMVASLDNALLSIADAVHLVGNYAYYLNLAAQVYTRADKDSFLPTE